MKRVFCAAIFIILFIDAFAQSPEIYPTHWWVGMKWNKVQLLVRGSDSGFNSEKVSISYAGVTMTNVHKFENGKYLAVDLTIAPTAKPGNVPIRFTGGGNTVTVQWPLKQRRAGNGISYAQGVTSTDFIYLLMPDRFSNGDTTNDHVRGMKDQTLNRDSIFLRHGGDLQGVMNHLDYLQGLGVTALWMTPVIENDMPDRTEHGYAFTNHYKIDPRLGGAEVYKRLSDSLHRRGMKLIQDAVYNHVGLYHFLVQDAPAKDWLHQWPVFTQPNYKEQVYFDPYAAPWDVKQMADGWFTRMMPDLNQGNPYVATFLIQHALWCVEEFGVDAWRIDTYKYVDLTFMNRCNKALTDEYPHITMFGENWCEDVANQAYFTRNIFNTSFKSNLTGTLDFEFLFNGIQPALTQTPGGVYKLYQTKSLDFLYQQPMNNVIFLDNHDMTRFFSQVKEDVKKQKMGIEWLLTERGIPEMYYGTEVLMKGISNPDGWVRLDFPGGWNGDKKSAFTGEGLSDDEIATQELVRKLAVFRAHSTAIKTGKMMQYVPSGGVYVYFRYDAHQTVMCIMNTADTVATVDFSRYGERTGAFTKARDILTDKVYDIAGSIEVPPAEMWVLEMK